MVNTNEPQSLKPKPMVYTSEIQVSKIPLGYGALVYSDDRLVYVCNEKGNI